MKKQSPKPFFKRLTSTIKAKHIMAMFLLLGFALVLGVSSNTPPSSATDDQINIEDIKENMFSNVWMSINDEAKTTDSLSVTLTFNVPKATEMLISNDPIMAEAEWETYQNKKDWELEDGNGAKTVYAMFRNEYNTSAMIADTIKYDGKKVSFSRYLQILFSSWHSD
ncbi:hypothetical protein ACFLZY_03150 [Patescibacteria group bacterium]